jgi:acetyl-CoA decarbonylase/synthase complex subunit gamma
MALSGIQIYKLLPQTNCKDCGFPTCLAFAMKLAAKQVELSACPHVSEESKAQLAESAAPPIRLVALKANGYEVKAGNEVVLFRHEKTFYHKPGLFIRVRDDEPEETIKARLAPAEDYKINYSIGWADEEMQMGLMRGRNGIPQTFIIGRDGKVVKHFVGFTPLVSPPQSSSLDPRKLKAAIEEAVSAG